MIDIKPLEWEEVRGGKTYWSETRPPLQYVVTAHPLGWAVTRSGSRLRSSDAENGGYFETKEAAFQAAQDDLRTRIYELLPEDARS